MYKGKPIAFVILSCRRTHLLHGVTRLFRKNCHDADLIDRWIILDDSHDPDHHAVLDGFPDFEVILKASQDKGHARSMNMLLDAHQAGYLIYWEDDAVLPIAGAWISQSCDILAADRDMLQVTWDQDLFTTPWHQDHPDSGLMTDPAPHRRYVPPPSSKFVAPADFTFYVDDWPGFTLRPHVLDLETFHSQANRRFDEDERQNFEYEMALACRAAGLTTASLLDCDICDVGALASSYVANGESRRFEEAGGLYTAGHVNDVVRTCASRSSPDELEAHIANATRWLRFDQDRQAAMQELGTALLRASSDHAKAG